MRIQLWQPLDCCGWLVEIGPGIISGDVWNWSLGDHPKCAFKPVQEVQGKSAVSSSADLIVVICWWGFGDWVAHQSKRGSQGFDKLSTHLNAWAAAATPMSVPSSSFGRRQRAASFLSSFGWKLSRWELGTSVQSESELDYLKHQHKVNLPLPILSCGKCEFETNMGEHLEESCWVFCASLDGEGGVVFLWRLLGHQLLEREKSMPALFVPWHISILPTISSTLSFLWSLCSRLACNIRHSQQWESETEIRWDFSIIWIFKSTLTKIRKHEKVFDSCFRANNSIRRILIFVDNQ